MNKDSKYIFIIIIVILGLVLVTIGMLNGLKIFYPDLSDRALFGESTGFVSVIFSGLSILLVIFTLFFQIDDLKRTKEIQSKQIKLTTKQIINENNKLLFSLENDLMVLESNSHGPKHKRVLLKKTQIDLLKKEMQEMKDINYE